MGTLINGLKEIFNTNNYTSETSGIASKKIPVNESNGMPSGQIGITDLEEVFGVRMKELTSSTDLDDLTNSGFYYSFSGSMVNKPSLSTNVPSVIEVRKDGRSWLTYQVYTDSNAKRFLRARYLSQAWSTWKEIV